MTLIDYSKLEGRAGEELRTRFRTAEPFPHAVIEDTLLGEPDELANAFPEPSWKGWTNRTWPGQTGKWSCRDIDVMPEAMRELIVELSAPRFLRGLARITSIDALLPDPFLQGGGLQCMDPGGVLAPHLDRDRHPTFGLFRRVNVLVYLTRQWEPGDGGEFALFDFGDDHPSVTVPPRFGSCVIFAHDHRSVHSVQPLTGSRRRCSIALFYYTVDAADTFSADVKDNWYPTDSLNQQDLVVRARLKTMKTALKMAKVLTYAAHRVDPQESRQLV